MCGIKKSRDFAKAISAEWDHLLTVDLANDAVPNGRFTLQFLADLFQDLMVCACQPLSQGTSWVLLGLFPGLWADIPLS